MSAVREAIAWLRRMQWKPGPHLGVWICRGCGVFCHDNPNGHFDTPSRSGHACHLTRTIEDAEREARAA